MRLLTTSIILAVVLCIPFLIWGDQFMQWFTRRGDSVDSRLGCVGLARGHRLVDVGSISPDSRDAGDVGGGIPLWHMDWRPPPVVASAADYAS